MKKLIALHTNDKNQTDFVLHITGKNGVHAVSYERSWDICKTKADEAAKSQFALSVVAINRLSGEKHIAK